MLRRDPLANPEALIKRVYSYVAYRLGDGPDAEDVTSAVFERAVRYRSSFKNERGDAVGWILGIARRCVADHYAGAHDIPSESVEQETDGHEDSSLEKIVLRAAVAKLSEDEQELLALRYGAGLSARQIAELLGERTNAVEVRLHRVLGRLRVTLTQPEPAAERATGQPLRATS